MDKDKAHPCDIGPAAPDHSGRQASALDDDRSAPLTLDFAAYAPYLEECDMSEQQKREFLETLWSIMLSFVDLGFGVHPIQQACGEEGPNGKYLAPDLSDVISSDDQTPQLKKIRALDHDEV